MTSPRHASLLQRSRQPGNRLFWSFSVLLYASMAWLLSGLSRGGVWTFAAALLLLAGAGALAARGRRTALFTLYLVAMLASTAVLVVEAVLWVAPDVLSGQVANTAYSGYHTRAGGIYRLDRHLGHALRPDCTRRMYWNGHWWTHETSGDGYRGRRVERADAVFLGDSMIYGHGVETSETVAARFEAATGLVSVNLGQQAISLAQAYILLARHGERLAPRYVFLCCHYNDVPELTAWYDPDTLRAIVAAGVADRSLPVAREKYQPRWELARWWNQTIAPPLRAAGAWRGLRRALREPDEDASAAAPRLDAPSPFRPSQATLDHPFRPASVDATGEQRLQWRAHTHFLLRIKAICAGLEARLVVFDLGYPHAFSRAIEELCTSNGIRYSPAGREVLRLALDGEEVYLSGDGHWSPRGSREIAARLVGFAAEGQRDGGDH